MIHRRQFPVLLWLGLVALPQPAAARDTQGWDDASTVVRDGLVLAALGIPAIRGDWQGDLQAAGSMTAAELGTVALKEGFPEWRPDHSSRRSFPSGHAAVSFAAAATLQNRYGWKIGVPAQLAAGFVGLARVEARKHHWYDVAVGAAIGEASGFLITSKRDARVTVLPWGNSHGGGATIAARF
ncbi:MAG TPA: phosphatase PAP2 family protein [Sphingomonas sp.]|nr:phosphatase PAP2 family protein [Sphingomonas sp.]